MKSVLISIRSQWYEKIASGKKTIEVRKSAPKEVPFKAYIYCTKEKPFIQKFRFGDIAISHTQISKNLYSGKVIGEFICDKVYSIKNQGNSFVVANEEQGVTNEIARQSCLDYDDMVGYLGNKDGYGLHITDLKIYGCPKELSEFSRPCSYAGLCFSCDRATFTSKGDRICQAMITRPPQSYMFVEELKEV